jgi:excisionase family DNA binding protein
VSDPISTQEAGDLLGASKPTVRALIEKGQLSAAREERASRFVWRVDRRSVDRYLSEHGRLDGRRRARLSPLKRIEAELSLVRATVEARAPGSLAENNLERERDDLRAEVVSLRDALARTRVVADLQRDADVERAAVVEHLLAASAAGERADVLRRQALAALDEALAGFTRPGHAGVV